MMIDDFRKVTFDDLVHGESARDYNDTRCQ